METKLNLIVLASAFIFAGSPSESRAQDIIGGVARTVEDIGGQIVGNQAARNGNRAVQRYEENVNHDRQGAVAIQTLPSAQDEGYKTLEGVYDTPVPAKPKRAKTPKVAGTQKPAP